VRCFVPGAGGNRNPHPHLNTLANRVKTLLTNEDNINDERANQLNDQCTDH
jgi:hypothetical protein